MTARTTILEYYDTLRAGEPLGAFFASEGEGDDAIVKFGISEQLVGGDEIRAGLREQTSRTTGWTIESDALRVTDRERHAWFSDDVFMAWTDTERGIRYEFDTRWSGTLEYREDWEFVGMHVSTAGSL